MKKITAFVLSFLFFPQLVLAYYNPGTPVGFVNDFAGIIDSGTKAKLESDLQKFEIDTKHEITVVTIKSLQDDTIENFAVKLFEDWQIGKKGADNGVLFLVALDDRKMRIEVGYGLEGALPDATAYQIINQIVKPAFQASDYSKGIVDGTNAIMVAVKGEDVSYLIDSTAKKSSGVSKKLTSDLIYFGFIIVFFFLRMVSYKFSQSKKWWPGGVLGGVFGLIIGLFVTGLVLGIFWWALGFGIFGLLLDYFVSKKGPPKGGPGGGMFWGGFGRHGGSGSGGGGFGGFGGGHSGGGGSSGSW